VADAPSARETERQYRVLQQTLSAHAALRDGYSAKAKAAEIVLLVCATIFCATTFAGEGVYADLGVSAQTGRLVLGVASVLAFGASLAILVIDWRGSAARHGDAAQKWTAALEEFRRRRLGDGSWPEEERLALNAAYWEADTNSVSIPEKSFNRLKARHLRKVEVSKLLSKYPGCPRPVLVLMIHARDTRMALRRTGTTTGSGNDAEHYSGLQCG
jgi:hypothetical protein